MKKALPEDRGDSGPSCFILAGGSGDRLRPLTLAVPKPLLPFGAVHRLLDFTLSNVRNSGLSRAYVLSQYMHEDIGRHLGMYWRSPGPGRTARFLNQPPTSGKRYRGTADAVAHNMEFVASGPNGLDPVLILSADHVYRMDYRKLLARHASSGAGATVAAIPVPRDAARQFGVISADGSGRILSFEEKPADPIPFPGRERMALANMGVYVFSGWILRRAFADLRYRTAALDFGRDVLPWMAARDLAQVYQAGEDENAAYWRDVGTLTAYHDCHMEWLDGRMGFDTCDAAWPMYAPGDRVVRASSGAWGGTGRSVAAASALVRDSRVERSVVGEDVVIEDGADVRNSVLLPGARIGQGAAVRNAIVAEGARVAAGDRVGFDRSDDLERFGVTETGIVIVPACFRERIEAVPRKPTRPPMGTEVNAG